MGRDDDTVHDRGGAVQLARNADYLSAVGDSVDDYAVKHTRSKEVLLAYLLEQPEHRGRARPRGSRERATSNNSASSL